MTTDVQVTNPESRIDACSSRTTLDLENRTSGGGFSKKILAPPPKKGMTVLDKAAFDKEIELPTITVPISQIKHVVRKLKPYLLKIRNFPNLIPVKGSDSKKVLLDPDKVTDMEEFFATVAPYIDIDPELKNSSTLEKFLFTYDHWSYHEIVDSILPDDMEKFSGYSSTGHVVHVNLKEHILPYKHIIGEILLDKLPYAKTVVNKLEQIDSVYRNFQMDFLAGERNTVVTLKENKYTFEFDFATVYWNSRLSTEHERVVNLLETGCIVFDVFAGVGPFAIPAAARKKCVILANDLNPESTKWLARNVQLNKVSERVQVFNKDGRDFIRDNVAKYLRNVLLNQDQEDSPTRRRFHMLMNLPAIAVEFLNALWNLFEGDPKVEAIPSDFKLTVHVYCFVKDIANYKEKALQMVKDQLQYDLTPADVVEVSSVRNVAPNKEMLRVSFDVPHEILRNLAPTVTVATTTSTGGCGVKRKLDNDETE